MITLKVDLVVDAQGLLCPEPLLRLKLAMNKIKSGQVIEIMTTDPSAEIDFKVFARQTTNVLLKSWQKNRVYHHLIQKN